MNSLAFENTKYDFIKVENYLQKIDTILEKQICINDTLFGGNLGRLLYFMYRYRTSDNIKFGEIASDILEQVFLNLNTGKSGISFNTALSNGLSGFTTIIGLLQEDHFLELELGETIEQFEEIIYQNGLSQIKQGNLDYLHGTIGGLLYLTSRVEQNVKVKEYIFQIVENLERNIIDDEKGIRFKNLLINKLNNTPDEINLGFAHGLSGIIIVLLRIYEVGITTQRIEKIIRGAIKYLINTYREVDFLTGQYSHFPTVANEEYPLEAKENQKAYRDFLGWCYGDLNQVIMLYQAGNMFNEPSWILLAETVGDTTLKRTLNKGTKIKDMFLCHGSSGLSLMYQSLIHISGNEKYQQGVDYWQQVTLQYLEDYHWDNTENKGSLLGGLEGVGLSLMTLNSGVDLLWKRVFLLP